MFLLILLQSCYEDDYLQLLPAGRIFRLEHSCFAENGLFFPIPMSFSSIYEQSKMVLPLLVVYNSNLLLLAEFMLEFYILFDLLGTAKPSLKRSLNRALTILMCGFIM